MADLILTSSGSFVDDGRNGTAYTYECEWTVTTNVNDYNNSTLVYKVYINAPAATSARFVGEYDTGYYYNYGQVYHAASKHFVYDFFLQGETIQLKKGRNLIATQTVTGLDFYDYNGLLEDEHKLALSVLFYDDNGDQISLYEDGGLWGVELDLTERVPFISSIICSAAYLGGSATITVSKKNKSYTHKIDYQFGSLSGAVVGETSSTTINWQLPISFLSQFGPSDLEKKGTLTCTTYNTDGTVEGTSTCEFTALLDANAAGPTINPTFRDINPITLALTGNENKLIRYYSNAEVNTGVTPQQGATISSIKTTWGNKSFTGATGTIAGVDTDTFSITAQDTRGLTSVYNKTLTAAELIPYVKLTANATASNVGTNGKFTLTVSGNYFNGSFGAVNNSIQVKYSLTTSQDYIDWKNISNVELSGDTYTCSVERTGMDYQVKYYLRISVTTALEVVESQPTVVMGMPVFEWSNRLFQFNVPATVKGNFTVTGRLRTAQFMTDYDAWTPQIQGTDITGVGHFFRINEVCVVNFFIQGSIPTTTTKVKIVGLPVIPDGTRWWSGGGNVSGYTLSTANTIFTGWNIEDLGDGTYGICGRTGPMATSTTATNSSAYIGAKAGDTFIASGTIMYAVGD